MAGQRAAGAGQTLGLRNCYHCSVSHCCCWDEVGSVPVFGLNDRSTHRLPVSRQGGCCMLLLISPCQNEWHTTCAVGVRECAYICTYMAIYKMDMGLSWLNKALFLWKPRSSTATVPSWINKEGGQENETERHNKETDSFWVASWQLRSCRRRSLNNLSILKKSPLFA